MSFQQAILGLATVGNTPLGYVHGALTAIRQTRVRVTLAGELVTYRHNSITIRDVANDAPNTCSLTIDPSTPPVNGQRIRITINSDSPRLLFAGALETVDETYEGKPEHIVYPCTAQDDTPRANRRIPLGYWENISATTVTQELIAQFAPGFTTNGVQLGLPAITVHFEGSEARMNGCLRAIAKLIGGYFYWEDRDLHLFTEETTDLPDALDSTPGRFLHEPHIRIIRDDKSIRTLDFGKGHGEATLAEVAAGTSAIPLQDVSFYNPFGGQVISESQILTYTGTVTGGEGALVGTTVTPTNAPTASPRTAASGIDAGDHYWAYTFYTGSGDTLPSPLSAILTMGAVVTAPSTAPAVSRLNGGNLSLGVYKWKLAFKDALGNMTTVGPESASLTMEDLANTPAAMGTASSGSSINPSSMDTSAVYSYKQTFVNGSLETLPSPASNTFMTGAAAVDAVGILARSGTSAPPAGYSRQFYRTEGGGGVWKRMTGPSNGFTQDDAVNWNDFASDASLGAAAPTVSTANYRKAQLTSLPSSADPNVTLLAIYRTIANGSTFYHVTDVANGTGSYVDDTTDAALVDVAPTTNTAVYRQAALSGIATGPSGTTGRKVYRTAAGGAQLKLAYTIANNTATTQTDSLADSGLGANVPTSDTSGLVAQTGDVPAGSTSMLVTSTGPFQSTGGWAFIGALPIRYGGVSATSLTGIPSSGPGALSTTVRYSVEVIASAMLTGVSGIVRTLIKGAPINVWVQRDDLAAQAALAAREEEGDGIIEHRITDERRNEASLIALCDADLAQFSRGTVTVMYATRDVKTRSGKPIVIDLPSPFIDETLTINDVVVTEIDIAPRLAPKFTVTASNIGVVTVEDLLRRMANSLEGQ